MRFSSLIRFFAFFIFVAFTTVAFAQDVIIPIVGNDEFFKLLIESIGGVKGASSLAIAGLVVQLVLKFLSTEMAGQVFKKLSGGTKLVVVLGLTLASGVLAMISSGVPVMTALLHSSTLSAFSVLAHQIYKQYFENKEPVILE